MTSSKLTKHVLMQQNQLSIGKHIDDTHHMAGKSSNSFFYPAEDDIIKLRKGFRLAADGYLSKGSLLYILETVKDLSNKDYEEALVAKAAYILFNIIATHPFIDGNKRTAFGTADAFLRLNGYSIMIDAADGVKFIVKIAAGDIEEIEKVRKWIKQHLKKL
jgi:death-on-curing family protein